MRLMYFSPTNNLISVKTYSPYTDQFETDSSSQFTLSYNMQLPTGLGVAPTAYVPVGTNTGVAPGSQSSFVWRGVQANKIYEWYAVVTDSFGNSFRTGPRTFTTSPNLTPFASNRTVTVTGDQPAQLVMLGSDPNGDALTFKTNTLPARGLNTSFNPINGTVTYTPARGYRGSDQFTYSVNDGFVDSSPATFSFNVVAPTDTNGNGLPDAWESLYGVTDPNADADSDGASNLAEYLASTNPTNSDSLLRITSTASQPNGQFTITWSSVGGTRYRVQYSDNLAGGSFSDVVLPISVEMDPAPFGSASTRSFTDTSAPNGPRFYRVKVTP